MDVELGELNFCSLTWIVFLSKHHPQVMNAEGKLFALTLVAELLKSPAHRWYRAAKRQSRKQAGAILPRGGLVLQRLWEISGGQQALHPSFRNTSLLLPTAGPLVQPL